MKVMIALAGLGLPLAMALAAKPAPFDQPPDAHGNTSTVAKPLALSDPVPAG